MFYSILHAMHTNHIVLKKFIKCNPASVYSSFLFYKKEVPAPLPILLASSADFLLRSPVENNPADNGISDNNRKAISPSDKKMIGKQKNDMYLEK